MGKEEELWDDTVLINAFNSALSKYKVMHNQGENTYSTDEINVITGREESSLIVNGQNNETRHSEKDSDEKAASSGEIGDAGSPSRLKNHCKLGNVGSSRNEQNILGDQTVFTNLQSLEDYNQLLTRYYELEDQRQQILQQLSLFGYWDSQNYKASGLNYRNTSQTMYTSQEPQPYTAQASCSTVACSCCPYGCQVLVPPCPSLPSCDLGAACVDKRDNASSRVEGEGHEEIKSNIASETEFNVVMNAWYTAGFYTGKYLAEQKRQG